MKPFIQKFLIFLIPFYIYAIFIVVIDPFNYFRIVRLRSEKEKTEVFLRTSKTMSYGSMLWKVNDFRHHPCPNIILGDSRTFSLDTGLIHRITGEKYYNLAVQIYASNSLKSCAVLRR